MIYFDPDVLINYLIEQDKEKNAQAVGLYNHASEKGEFFCSLLCLQETSAGVCTRMIFGKKGWISKYK